jgi:hypothetical protein
VRVVFVVVIVGACGFDRGDGTTIDGSDPAYLGPSTF